MRQGKKRQVVLVTLVLMAGSARAEESAPLNDGAQLVSDITSALNFFRGIFDAVTSGGSITETLDEVLQAITGKSIHQTFMQDLLPGMVHEALEALNGEDLLAGIHEATGAVTEITKTIKQEVQAATQGAFFGKKTDPDGNLVSAEPPKVVGPDGTETYEPGYSFDDSVTIAPSAVEYGAAAQAFDVLAAETAESSFTNLAVGEGSTEVSRQVASKAAEVNAAISEYSPEFVQRAKDAQSSREILEIQTEVLVTNLQAQLMSTEAITLALQQNAQVQQSTNRQLGQLVEQQIREAQAQAEQLRREAEMVYVEADTQTKEVAAVLESGQNALEKLMNVDESTGTSVLKTAPKLQDLLQ